MPTSKGVGTHLPDEVLDDFDRCRRRLRPSMVRPPEVRIPVPSLGRHLDVAEIGACDAVAELGAEREHVAVKDIAELLALDHSTVSRLIGEIEAKGLVRRGTDPKDRRRTTVTLTELGQHVVHDSAAISREMARVLFADWTREEVDELIRSMTRLADTLSVRMQALPELMRSAMELSVGDQTAPGQSR